jgi:ubiquinone/menaquinone biosynthesis C-methylase UbiE
MTRHNNWDADEYANASSMQYRQALELIDKIKFNSKDRVLDVGCGDGKISRYISGFLEQGEILGIDITESMLDYAKKTNESIKNLSFKQMDANCINLAKHSFDKVVSFSCLHWVRNQQSLWNSFHNLLSNNGKVYAGFQVDHELFWDIVSKYSKMKEWLPYFSDFDDPYNHFTRDQIEDYITSANFRIDRIDEIHQIEYFENYHGIEKFLSSWVPQFRHLPISISKKFVTKVLEDYFDLVPDFMSQNAGIRIKRFEIEATKL